MDNLRLLFLGTPEFENGGQPVERVPSKAIALLAYLAVQREPQSRERILGLLWANSASEAAHKNLRNTLWSIRRLFGTDPLIADGSRLELGDSAWMDVKEFERIANLRTSARERDGPISSQHVKELESAVALYRGPLLDDFSLPDAPEFEIWLTTERERFAQLYVRSLEPLVKAHRANADWRAVIDTARRSLEFDMLQEPMHRALMEAYDHLGERPEALRQYDTLRAALERELGVEPLPETEELREAIVNGRLGSQDLGVAPKRPHPYSQRASSPRTPFIGREEQRTVLDAELAEAMTSRARVALIVGELGIGKSRLWREWSGSLTGVTILQARCFQSTHTVTFQPIIDLFRNRAILQRLRESTVAIDPIWLAQLKRLLPEISPMSAPSAGSSTLPAEEERHRLFEALVQCLLALGTLPLIIFIDDLHWADSTSLDWLDYLVHRLQDHPLLLVAAYRTEDAPGPLVRLVAGWGREGLSRHIPLSHLSPEESAELITALGGDPELAKRVETLSAGNPYFLVELYRAAPGEIPVPLHDLIRARIDGLPETARQVVQAAAILESEFDVATLRRTSGRGEEETLEALDTLISSNVLVERNTRYDFAHPLVATIVREGMSSGRRSFLHRRAGEAIESTFAGRLAPMAAQLAEHYVQAGELSRAAHFAEIAAEHALTLASPRQAAELYRRAIDLAPTPARHMGLGRALLHDGDLNAARQSLSVALGEFEGAGDRQGAARASLGLAETFFPAGRFEEGTRWMQKGLQYLGTDSDPVAHALAHLLLGSSGLNQGDLLSESEKNLRDAAQIAEENDLASVGARALFFLGNVLAQRGDLPGAIKAFREAAGLAHAAGDDYQQVLAYNNTAYHALLAGDLASAHENLDLGLALARERALIVPLQYLYSTRGEIALAEKMWGSAEDWFKRGLVEAQARGNREQVANYYANLALAARGRGHSDEALGLLEQAQTEVASLAAPHLQAKIGLWLAELHLERQERTAAIEALSRAEALLKDGTRAGLIQWAQKLRQQSDTLSRT